MYETKGIVLNSYGVNNAITYNILPDKEMEKIGFKSVREGKFWYYCKTIIKERNFHITFNVTIPTPINPSNELNIEVIDEDWLQPYDFQAMLEKEPDFKYALQVAEAFESQMHYLQNKGILSGHNRYEYV